MLYILGPNVSSSKPPNKQTDLERAGQILVDTMEADVIRKVLGIVENTLEKKGWSVGLEKVKVEDDSKENEVDDIVIPSRNTFGSQY